MELMNRNVKALLTRISEHNIDIEFKEGLIISSDEEDKEDSEPPTSKSYDLFVDIQSKSLSVKRKGIRFNIEQLLGLKMLLCKYAGDHQTKRRALKISSTAFCRLRRESSEVPRSWGITKCRRNSRTVLDQEQKIYISKLVQPPTFPITVMIFKNSVD